MKYKMIALDLDGTLKSSDATGRIILPKTKKILIELAKKGIVIVLASGRPTAGLYAEANELQLNDFGGYLLSFNGAKVVNYQTKEVIFQKIFDATTAHLVYDRAKKYNLAVMTYTDQEIITEDSADQYVQIESKINNMPLKQVDDFKAVVDYPVNKVLLTGKPEYAAKIEDEFKAPFKDSLVLMPGIAFDRNGTRAGYGGGYYDTYLRKHPEGIRIALAYSSQLLDTIPAESHDVRPEMIFTENECIVCVG